MPQRKKMDGLDVVTFLTGIAALPSSFFIAAAPTETVALFLRNDALLSGRVYAFVFGLLIALLALLCLVAALRMQWRPDPTLRLPHPDLDRKERYLRTAQLLGYMVTAPSVGYGLLLAFCPALLMRMPAADLGLLISALLFANGAGCMFFARK